jgi:hypothetical protein
MFSGTARQDGPSDIAFFKVAGTLTLLRPRTLQLTRNFPAAEG